jgi:prepilin-type processing-associated H-X9-DG protein
MTDPMHQQLLGHLLGALDDEEQEWVERRLDEDPDYRRHCLLWRRRLASVEAALPEFEPPPGLAERTCRLVAACAAAMASPRVAAGPRGKMSPETAFPAGAARVAWCDVAALGLLAVMAVALIFPAIYGSRFQARLAACQNNLRQFGLALAEYSHRQGEALSHLAADGHLTGVGLSAARLMEAGFAPNGGRALLPDAWLASQGFHNVSGTRRVPYITVGGDSSRRLTNNWPGTWRAGTADAEQESASLPTALPLLADAPSADMPGQPLCSHDGRGRNVFFADGQVRFLPCSLSADAAEIVLSGDSSADARNSTPAALLDWH